jgi:hypothetical protein
MPSSAPALLSTVVLDIDTLNGITGKAGPLTFLLNQFWSPIVVARNVTLTWALSFVYRTRLDGNLSI